MKSIRLALPGLIVLLGSLLSAVPAYADSLQDALSRVAPDADPQVIALAVRATQCRQLNERIPARRLAVIDYSLPSTEQRLWVFDLQRRSLLFRERVAHGRNSGENLASQFSNQNQSMATSLGLYRTLATYQGHNGYSLRMDGLEPGFNDNAFDRDIVIHGAPYVSEEFARVNGRIGRSQGCPAVRTEIAQPLIDSMKDGQLLFSYYPDPQWLSSSPMIHCPALTAGNSGHRLSTR
jgi:hypothetical protein